MLSFLSRTHSNSLFRETVLQLCARGLSQKYLFFSQSRTVIGCGRSGLLIQANFNFILYCEGHQDTLQNKLFPLLCKLIEKKLGIIIIGDQVAPTKNCREYKI